ncbi:hypothetical protein [Streptomyces sp. NPDC058268]|uniref:hypothetical protein n=1 Tax=Streptomyces sp. NPDC058268 TaxID=3346413 RepID=UPI0036E1D8C6
MGSLFEELADREEAAARVRVEELEEQLAEVTGWLEEDQGNLERLRIARETVSEVMTEMSAGASPVPNASLEGSAGADDDRESSAFAGAERRVVGVLTVPNRRPGVDTSALPRIYREIVEVVRDAPGPVRAKQIVPRIGLPAEVGKIEGTRGKLKRLVARADWRKEIRACSPRPAMRRKPRPTPPWGRALLPRVEGANRFDAAREEPWDGTV